MQVRKLMASSAPVPLHVAAAPEAADAEQLQAQQQALLTLGTRTMGLPIGRGALTLGEVPASFSVSVRLSCVGLRASPILTDVLKRKSKALLISPQ